MVKTEQGGNIAGKDNYLIVRRGKEILAFTFEMRTHRTSVVKHIYIAWEVAKEGGYASALKVLTMSHALDETKEKLTLDLCGGHWFSHPSARMMNLDSSSNMTIQPGTRKQAELLCNQSTFMLSYNFCYDFYILGKKQKRKKRNKIIAM